MNESMLRHGIRRGAIRRILAFVKSKSIVVEIGADLAEVAGAVNFRTKKAVKDWGMLDSFVYAVAKTKGEREGAHR